MTPQLLAASVRTVSVSPMWRAHAAASPMPRCRGNRTAVAQRLTGMLLIEENNEWLFARSLPRPGAPAPPENERTDPTVPACWPVGAVNDDVALSRG